MISLTGFIFGIYAIGVITVIIIIVYLIIRRIELKKQEDFEKRDN